MSGNHCPNCDKDGKKPAPMVFKAIYLGTVRNYKNKPVGLYFCVLCKEQFIGEIMPQY